MMEVKVITERLRKEVLGVDNGRDVNRGAAGEVGGMTEVTVHTEGLRWKVWGLTVVCGVRLCGEWAVV